MPDDFAQWLEARGLGKYATVFAENDVDFRALSALTEQDLKELGLSLGHRRILQQGVAALADSKASSIEQRASADALPSESETGRAAWERRPGERKPVTLLFADISGSTALTENLDAEETHDLLSGATERIGAAVENNRGTVCRLMGDGVMAMFGAPMASEQHALDACAAALEMQQAIRDFAAATGNSALKIRVGLHSGEVVVLAGGEGETAEYDATGPTVPIAARMEQVAEPGTVYLTAATRTLAGHRIDADALEPVRVKGISAPLAVFALRRVRSAEEALPDVARTPFVGRRAELKQFRAMLEACVEDGQGATVYIRGEPGIGKTRLIEEFGRIAAAKGASIHRGLVLPFGVAQGQDAIRSLVRSLLGIAPGSDGTRRQRCAEEALSDGRVAPDNGVFLYDLLDLPQSLEQRALYDAMDNRTRNSGKQAMVSELVTAISGAGPVLVIVEDAHWADPMTLGHLAALTRTAAECRALLILSSRVEGDPLDRSWRAGTEDKPFVTVDVGPLRRQDSMALISEFIDPDEPLAQSCLERAAGNPLFLEQLLRATEGGSADSLPDSIQSLILARLDRLDSRHKRALQAAAVIGQRFDAQVLSHLLAVENYDCREFVDHNLARPEGDGYLFAHALVQEGVYGSLLKHQRRALHRKAAEWYRGADAVLHAEHLANADDGEAPGAFLRAAREQAGHYRHARSLDLAQRGLTLAKEQIDRHELTCLIGELLRYLAEVEASTDAYREALANAVDDAQRADAWMGIAAGLRVTMADCTEALMLLDKVETFATGNERHSTLTRLHHLRGNLYFPLGRIQECYEQHGLALKFARKSASPEDEARAFGGLGDAEYARGRMRTAYGHYSRCIELSREHGFGRMEVSHLAQRGYTRLYSGDWRGAKTEAVEAAKAAMKVGDRRAEMNAVSCAFHAAIDLGEDDLVAAYAGRQLDLAHTLGARTWGSDGLAWKAIVLKARGHRTEARELLAQGVEIARNVSPAFQAGRFFGAMAWAMADDDTVREEALVEGEGLLHADSLSHNYFWFYRFAIDASLTAENWQRIERYAAALEEYTRGEPLGWSDFYIARGRVLAAFGRGNRGSATVQELQRLHDQAKRAGLIRALPALENALALT